jgi:hypothetical protein
VSLKLTGSLDNFLIFPYLINSEWSRFLPYWRRYYVLSMIYVYKFDFMIFQTRSKW